MKLEFCVLLCITSYLTLNHICWFFPIQFGEFLLELFESILAFAILNSLVSFVNLTTLPENLWTLHSAIPKQIFGLLLLQSVELFQLCWVYKNCWVILTVFPAFYQFSSIWEVMSSYSMIAKLRVFVARFCQKILGNPCQLLNCMFYALWCSQILKNRSRTFFFAETIRA